MIDPGMIRKLQKDLQIRMEKMKEQLQTLTVEGTAGGGVVVVVSNGNSEIQSVKIKPEAIDPTDAEMLQDLILAATNQALTNARALNEAKVSEITGGLNLPGFF